MMSPTFFLFVLSTIVAVTAAHPSPTAVEDTSSVENVKKHIAQELEKTDLDPAMLMVFLAKMMSSSIQQDNVQLVDCTDSDLTLNATFLNKIRNASINTYIYINDSNIMVPLPAEELRNHRDPIRNAGKIWADSLYKYSDSNPPTAVSTHFFVNLYEDINEKPTLFFARLLTYDQFEPLRIRNASQLDLLTQELFCLVTLLRAGITVEGWDLSNFRGDDDTCGCIASETDYNNNRLNGIVEKIIYILNGTESIGNEVLSFWCPDDDKKMFLASR